MSKKTYRDYSSRLSAFGSRFETRSGKYNAREMLRLRIDERGRVERIEKIERLERIERNFGGNRKGEVGSSVLELTY
jgi:hypothetical protein